MSQKEYSKDEILFSSEELQELSQDLDNRASVSAKGRPRRRTSSRFKDNPPQNEADAVAQIRRSRPSTQPISQRTVTSTNESFDSKNNRGKSSNGDSSNAQDAIKDSKNQEATTDSDLEEFVDIHDDGFEDTTLVEDISPENVMNTNGVSEPNAHDEETSNLKAEGLRAEITEVEMPVIEDGTLSVEDNAASEKQQSVSALGEDSLNSEIITSVEAIVEETFSEAETKEKDESEALKVSDSAPLQTTPEEEIEILSTSNNVKKDEDRTIKTLSSHTSKEEIEKPSSISEASEHDADKESFIIEEKSAIKNEEDFSSQKLSANNVKGIADLSTSDTLSAKKEVDPFETTKETELPHDKTYPSENEKKETLKRVITGPVAPHRAKAKEGKASNDAEKRLSDETSNKALNVKSGVKVLSSVIEKAASAIENGHEELGFDLDESSEQDGATEAMAELSKKQSRTKEDANRVSVLLSALKTGELELAQDTTNKILAAERAASRPKTMEQRKESGAEIDVKPSPFPLAADLVAPPQDDKDPPQKDLLPIDTADIHIDVDIEGEEIHEKKATMPPPVPKQEKEEELSPFSQSEVEDRELKVAVEEKKGEGEVFSSVALDEIPTKPEISVVARKPSSPPTAPPNMRKPAHKRAKAWFEDIFDEEYLRTVPFLTPEITQVEVKFLEEALSPKPKSELLDFGCGTGRHAIEFAKLGYRVTGLDLSLPLLIRAADDAQKHDLNVNFVHSDFREMSFEEQFDAAYCVNTSFGFFDDDTNRKIIFALNKALRTGGRLLLEIINRDYVIRDLPARIWWEGERCVVLEEVDFNYFTSRLQSKRSVVFEDGGHVEQDISLRLYSLHELGKILHHAGLRVLEVSGHYAHRTRFFGNESRSLILLAEKRPDKG